MNTYIYVLNNYVLMVAQFVPSWVHRRLAAYCTINACMMVRAVTYYCTASSSCRSVFRDVLSRGFTEAATPSCHYRAHDYYCHAVTVLLLHWRRLRYASAATLPLPSIAFCNTTIADKKGNNNKNEMLVLQQQLSVLKIDNHV